MLCQNSSQIKEKKNVLLYASARDRKNDAEHERQTLPLSIILKYHKSKEERNTYAFSILQPRKQYSQLHHSFSSESAKLLRLT